MTRPFRRLLHLGNIVVDVVLTVPALPEPGGDVLATSTQTTAGGGFNVMAAARRLGLAVAYAGALGTGPFAEVARTACAGEGIEVLRPAKTGADTGFVISIVDATGERTFLTSPGAEATLTAADLDGVRAGPGDAVYVSGYGLAHPANRVALSGWLARLGDGSTLVFDPGPLAAALPRDVLGTALGRADWLTCNAREAALLTGVPEPSGTEPGGTEPGGTELGVTQPGVTEPRRALELLASRWPRAGVLVRTGPDGCLLGRAGEPVRHIPGFAVTAVDTNGAGDTHTGAFLAALASGADEAGAARVANAAAALSVTRRGPATGPGRKDLELFLAAHPAEG